MAISKILPSHNGKKTAQGRFTKGNTFGKGRPQGAKNKITLFLEQVLENEAEEILRQAIKLALLGDVACIKLCLERLLPAKRENAIVFPLKPLHSAADAVGAMRDITNGLSQGELTPTETKTLSDMVEIYTRTLQTETLEQKVLDLKQRMDNWQKERNR